ncbi:hypothetical protein [Melaminivora sp.]
MEQNLKTGELNNSLTPSTRLLNQKLGTLNGPRELTPSEIELLLASKRELAALAFATPTRAGGHKATSAV